MNAILKLAEMFDAAKSASYGGPEIAKAIREAIGAPMTHAPDDGLLKLAEWQEARKAFLAVDHASPKDFPERKPLFDRLANAEEALMKVDVRASAQRSGVGEPDGWPAWFPATPADNERGEELFVGGYTWTLQGEDGPKEYKYKDGRWYGLNATPIPLSRCEVRSEDAIPLADHDEIGRKLIGQPWAIQAAIVTICAHCTVLVDKHPTGAVADLAGCISEQCRELTAALATRPADTSEREVVQPSNPATIADIHAALSAANLAYTGYSCNGVDVVGNSASIKAVTSAFHSHSQIGWYKTNLVHWREECGKLHARIAALPASSRESGSAAQGSGERLYTLAEAKAALEGAIEDLRSASSVPSAKPQTRAPNPAFAPHASDEERN